MKYFKVFFGGVIFFFAILGVVFSFGFLTKETADEAAIRAYSQCVQDAFEMHSWKINKK